MGSVFFADFLGGVCTLDNLSTTIKNRIGSRIERNQQVRALQILYNGSARFKARAPDDDYQSVMSKHNVSTYWKELCERYNLYC